MQGCLSFLVTVKWVSIRLTIIYFMHEENTKCEMTVYELAELMKKGFERLEDKVDRGFVEVSLRFKKIDERFDRLERSHGDRIELLEDDVVVIKKKHQYA